MKCSVCGVANDGSCPTCYGDDVRRMARKLHADIKHARRYGDAAHVAAAEAALEAWLLEG